MVWREVLLMCNIVRPLLSWAEEVFWMSTHARGSAFHHTVRRLAFAATVYHLWIERNRRCFKNAFLPCQEIIRLVKQDVCGKLASGNIYPSCERYHSLCVNWGVPFVEVN
ncbi:hypothetical protein CFOL_v3_10824 [Cephalotus follicularis]|uniref:Zf-RVT domain-containing protein n=1 Tax=Cephalotus follicularis TaxID=3775 RepID=A0A1Q3BHB5_CEPFO|nr:hypothetical protein CFOL_v3_10824 [Cephalotus follicularis]